MSDKQLNDEFKQSIETLLKDHGAEVHLRRSSTVMGDILSLIATGRVHEHMGHFRAACEMRIAQEIEAALSQLQRENAELRFALEQIKHLARGSADKIVCLAVIDRINQISSTAIDAARNKKEAV